ncbi:MAG: 2,3-bisphosphoglycerate-independent phosphoglycerate mutase [Verrucomicrobia bacterium]|nr:MAG: 2,3-bisphosphoglycerate-independent phosphoglycerate mutase [Verrucomicrobiota bacterium]
MPEVEVGPLQKIAGYPGPEGPVVLLIMDGIGIGKFEEGDMVRKATTPHLDRLKECSLYSTLKAHGTAVGLPSDKDMGNSEVGHNAIGAGRVYDQGARLVNKAIQSGALFRGPVWKELISNCLQHNSTLHFIGLLSDGNVHSHIDQLKALIGRAAQEGVKRVRVHVLLDGRDVPPTSALVYVDDLEGFLAEINRSGDFDYRIASGGGRMKVTMDRYEADWRIVERGWRTHVKGEGRGFRSAREAIETYRRESPGIIDQDLPPFVIVDEQGTPVGPIRDNDSVIFFNFRGDRAIEISRAFEEPDFSAFRRDPYPKVLYAGMMEYDGDLHIPKKFLVAPPAIDRTLGEYLVASGVSQMAISETQKFGHVTYFFNGNRSGKFDEKLEDYIEIPSDRVPFEQRPWMKAAEITDRVAKAVRDNAYRFIRLNYANGDMVGHTGVFQAVEIAVESVDLCIGRVLEAVAEARGILVVSADHGNADDMFERKPGSSEVVLDPKTGQPKAKTSHSLNPVPVYVYDPVDMSRWRLSDRKGLGIASLAATCLVLLGFQPPEDYEPPVINLAT